MSNDVRAPGPGSPPQESGRYQGPLEKIDALAFLARVITQIPEPKRHSIFYYGRYADFDNAPSAAAVKVPDMY